MKDRTRAALERIRPDVFPIGEAPRVFAFQQNLAESQWFPRQRLETYQLGHLKTLARQASRHAAYYAERLELGAIEAATTLVECLSAIPILPRDALANQPLAFRCDRLPDGHQLVGERQSSGSTGQIVTVAVSDIGFAWQNALTFRGQLWAERKFGLGMAIIRKNKPGYAEPPDGATSDSWDSPSVLPFRTGPAYHLGTTASIEAQWDWLGRVKPAYLFTYPSIVRQFAARAAVERRVPARLLGITTIGETVDVDLRDAAKRHLGAEIHDVYSTEEAGTLALQCPDCRRYHIQSEAVIVEVLDDANKPCRAGEMGRVVVTPLFNHATPLLRYDIGDVAEAGSPCACGRGLPVLNKIIGRQRNLLKLQDGRHFWPSFKSRFWQKVVPVRQHQFRQVAIDTIEAWLVPERPISSAEEAEIRRIILSGLPGPFELRIQVVDVIPQPASGKYEEFVSLI